MSERRRFYIAFGGDPSNDNETYKRYVGVTPITPMPGEDIVQAIELQPGDLILSREQVEKLRHAIRRGLEIDAILHVLDSAGEAK